MKRKALDADDLAKMATEKAYRLFLESKHWSDFRSLFDSDTEAYHAYAEIVSCAYSPEKVAGTRLIKIRWTKKFVDSEAGRRQVLLLPLLLAGFLAATSNRIYFDTFHSYQEIGGGYKVGILLRRLFRFASGCLFVASGVLVLIGSIGSYLMIHTADRLPYLICIALGFVLLPVGVYAYKRSMQYGLTPIILSIARGVFDVYGIQEIRRG